MSKLSKYIPALVIIGVVAVIVVAAVASGHRTPKVVPNIKSAVQPAPAHKIVTIAGQAINAEVPITPAQKEKGLGGRAGLAPDQGMLFVFEKPGQYFIWMKDMKFPIDILWISSSHTVVGVERDVKPNTYPSKFANKDKPAQYVLELKANRSTELGVTLGTAVDF